MGPPLFANIFSEGWEWLQDASEWLEDFSANWWFLAIIFAVAFFDSIVPIVPSETMVIIGGVAAGAGDQQLLAVIASGAVGAFLGDNAAYVIGARLSGWIERRATERPTWQTRLDWAEEQIKVRGGPLLVTARFIPGGRTALTVSSGITHQPRRWFVSWIAVAVLIWASYAAILGYAFGETFDHSTAFLLAFGTALAINVAIEVIRHQRNKRQATTALAADRVHALDGDGPD
jgi:membrane protein DedA with SNARE-associated domain